MTRYVILCTLACGLAGCHAPAPSLDVLAPYGSPRVPPPRTGAIGTGGTYYAPTTPNPQAPSTTPPAGTTAPIPPAGLPAVPATSPVLPSTSTAAPPSTVPPVSYMGGANETMSEAATHVAAASYRQGDQRDPAAPPATTVTDASARSKSAASISDATSSLQLNGMRVNDATRANEPEQFTPAGEPVNIASLPAANSNTPSFLRFVTPKGGNGTGTPTPPPATGSTSTGTWQSR
jgi:hypothetical protein